jgi:hypothetical protein
MELCPVNITPKKENILQVHSNQYLVYFPESVTSNVKCVNQSNMEIFIIKGISQINVSHICHTALPKHVIIYDHSHKPETDLKHYKWVPHQTTQPETSHARMDSAFQSLMEVKADYPT